MNFNFSADDIPEWKDGIVSVVVRGWFKYHGLPKELESICAQYSGSLCDKFTISKIKNAYRFLLLGDSVTSRKAIVSNTADTILRLPLTLKMYPVVAQNFWSITISHCFSGILRVGIEDLDTKERIYAQINLKDCVVSWKPLNSKLFYYSSGRYVSLEDTGVIEMAMDFNRKTESLRYHFEDSGLAKQGYIIRKNATYRAFISIYECYEKTFIYLN